MMLVVMTVMVMVMMVVVVRLGRFNVEVQVEARRPSLVAGMVDVMDWRARLQR